ncbi:hypothetical protein BG004_004200 [Podila humilis]|nr:hypothetical protein BG004_004200 [Podila humilis]
MIIERRRLNIPAIRYKSDFIALGSSLSPLSSLTACRTPPDLRESTPSSPERPLPSPPARLDFVPRNSDIEQEHFFSSSLESLQDVVLKGLQDGRNLPSWMKDRPRYTFELQLRDDWGPRVINLLHPGIVHLNKSHIGFSAIDSAQIFSDVLQSFYSQGMEDRDMQRAQDASTLWVGWISKTAQLKEKLAAQKESREPGEVDMAPVIDAIMSSYTECKIKKITLILFIALHVFRRFNNWATLTSESDCMTAVVGPILQEVMDVQHTIKFTCRSNASTTAGKSMKSKLQQDGQSRQPDIIGLTRDKEEVFYSELKGPNATLAAVNTDLLRLAIFTKDSLDHLHAILEKGPPLVTFQTVGREVTFFWAPKSTTQLCIRGYPVLNCRRGWQSWIWTRISLPYITSAVSCSDEQGLSWQ